MLGNQLILGTLMVVVTVIVHICGLLWLTDILRRRLAGRMNRLHRGHGVVLASVAVFWILLLHTVEAWMWAALYLGFGEFPDLSTALYFSVATSTTLGYGDLLLSEQWRLLGTFEAMAGFILFGASTAYLLEVLRRSFFQEEH